MGHGVGLLYRVDLPLARPFRQEFFTCTPDQNMNMLKTTNALQCNPILEPQNLSLSIRTELINEEPLNEVRYDPTTLCSHIATLWVRINCSPRPYDYMSNVRGQTIRPIIDKDRIIRWVLKGHG